MKRIVVDLTEFGSWSGHLTGVQRVVFGLAKSVYDSGEGDFIAFDDGYFYSVDPEEFFKHFIVHNEVTAAQVPPTPTPRTKRQLVNKRKIKSVVRRMYYRLPVSVRQQLTPSRRDKIKHFARIASSPHIWSRRGRAYSILMPRDKEKVRHQFKKDDIVLSATRAWDYSTYIDTLNRLKGTIGIRISFVVYDLVPIYQQHTFGPGLTERYSRYLYEALTTCDYLLPISNSTKNDLLKYAEEIGVIELPSVVTIRLGDDIVESVSDIVPAFVDAESFAITVGTIEARKNHIEIYMAYKLALDKGINLPKLYIIGKPGWLTGDVIYAIENDTDINRQIKIVQNVSDEELSWLYKHALFTVYPSQYEGWGLPVAESLAYGTPCIASNKSSMAEIAPEYTDSVSPFDPAALLEQMEHYTDSKNSNARRRQIERGYKVHRWGDTLNQIKKTVGK
jgi:glycosyltransferase involved in cell wall biosynthesis